MTPNSRVIGVLLAVWAPFVVLTGCTGTDVLTSGSGDLEFRAELDNASGRFVDNPFDRARLDVEQIEIRPTNADADAALGSVNLGLIDEEFGADFVSGISKLAITPQTSGTYRLIRMLIPRIVLSDTDDLTVAGLSDPVVPACHDFIKDADLGLGGQAALFGIENTDLPAPVTVTLDANNPGRLTLRLDYPGFLAAINASLDCASCGCPAAYMPNQIPRSCSGAGSACTVDADCPPPQTCEDCTCPVSAINFDGSVFKSLASTFVSFE